MVEAVLESNKPTRPAFQEIAASLCDEVLRLPNIPTGKRCTFSSNLVRRYEFDLVAHWACVGL